jgi:hypothetical protein
MSGIRPRAVVARIVRLHRMAAASRESRESMEQLMYCTLLFSRDSAFARSAVLNLPKRVALLQEHTFVSEIPSF